MKRINLLFSALILSLIVSVSCSQEQKPVRLLYWNIQNGMWCGQDDNYNKFVEWVKGKNPDICVWCEGQSIYKSGTADYMDTSEQYLVDGWPELANRYGHSYVYIGGYRDDYPQVITSNRPISNVKRIIGSEPDSIVTHGSGWAQIEINGKVLNLVTLHTWPKKWGYRVADQEASKENHEGDKYRKMELDFICKETILSVENAENEDWLMMGDFNSHSRIDNFFYNFPEDDTRFLVHDYIANETPYLDVIAKRYPSVFKTTTGKEKRIDFVYSTKPLYDKIVWADVICDDYTKPIRDPQNLSNFYHPSDHLPIIIDMNL